jgi:flagellar hook-basal body complex protein FliE
MSVLPIEAISAAASQALAAPAATNVRSGFSDLLLGGVDKVNHQVLDAQSLASAFAVDDSVPVHQVTYALEQARLSTELMLQVRSKLADGLLELLRMQL